MDRALVSKDEVLKLIGHLEKPLEFYKDPVYTQEEKEVIKKFEELTGEFYKDLKNDKHVIFRISKRDEKEEKRILRFTKMVIDISNKLVRTEEFNAEEGWFILLSLYCWNCEMIKNLLLDVTVKIYESLEGKAWEDFMTMGPFIDIMNRYKNGKYTFLFSEIDVDLRNSFVHGKIDFPNNEIEYYDSNDNKKKLKLDAFLSKYKKMAPLYATLFFYEKKIFLDEIKDFAKKKGFL